MGKLSRRPAIQALDKILQGMHLRHSALKKLLMMVVSIAVYVAVILIFGNKLKISSNYFIIIPLISACVSFGFLGGVIGGVLALPLNLLMFHLLGQPDYSPESKLIAEFSGIIIGATIGYLNDYYFEIEEEIKRRRIAEEKLLQLVDEKEILIHEVHHRVKNNLNIVKSLIQLQMNRSSDQGFKDEAENLIRRIYSISRVHEQLYKGHKSMTPSLSEYVPSLVNEILAGIDKGEIELEYDLNIPEIRVTIEQATSLGLILNEVLTNAVKYSFSLVESPELQVILRTKADKTIIELINNAPTFIPDGDDYDGLGLKLIKTLCGQLDADYEYVPGNGTTFRLILPI